MTNASNCSNCGAIVDLSAQRSCPACGAALPLPVPPVPSFAPRAVSGSVPWEDPARGFFDRLLETTKRVLSAPGDFFRHMPVTGGFGRPMMYALLLGSLAIWVGVAYQGVSQGVMGMMMPSGGDRYAPLARMVGSGVGLVMTAVLAPVLVLIGLFLGAGVTHLALVLFGGAKQGFEATFRVACYAFAPSVITIVPFCGGMIGGIWRIVVMIIGVSEAHGVSKGVAAAAVLVPLVVLCCCCGGAIVAAVSLPFLSQAGR